MKALHGSALVVSPMRAVFAGFREPHVTGGTQTTRDCLLPAPHQDVYMRSSTCCQCVEVVAALKC